MLKIIDLGFLDHNETIASFLLETEEGPVLVETGPHSCFARLEAGIREAGHAVKDIKHVFLTHIHLDHAGAAWKFAEQGAFIYVHPLGRKHLVNPEKLLASARMIYGAEMDRLWGKLEPIPEAQIREASHNQRFKIGKTVLKALYTPGHAIHHIAWQWGDSLFTGDIAGVKISSGIVVPPCPPPDINLEEWKKSLQLIRRKRFSRLLLTHFGEVTQVKDHLKELEGRLMNWANWMKPHWENQTPDETIIPLFEAYVRKQLEAAKVVGEDLERYESANPAWMSVAGLLRYWKKKETKTS